LLGDFKLHWPGGLFLYHNCACGDAVAVGDITNLQLNEIAGPELAVDAKVKQR